MIEEVEALLYQVEALETAVEGLLEWARRHQGGDPTLDPEEYYIARDFAHVTLNKSRAVDA